MTRCNGRANHCFNSGEQHRLQKRTASLANLQLRSKFGSWIDGKERIRKQQSLRIDVHVSRTGTFAICMHLHLAGERAGQGSTRHALTTPNTQRQYSQPCMPTAARQCERCCNATCARAVLKCGDGGVSAAQASMHATPRAGRAYAREHCFDVRMPTPGLQ